MADIPYNAPVREFVRGTSGSLCAECQHFGIQCGYSKRDQQRSVVNSYVCVTQCRGFKPMGKEGGE